MAKKARMRPLWKKAKRIRASLRNRVRKSHPEAQREADNDHPNPHPSPAGERQEPAQTEGDVPNFGPTSDPSGRDFGGSAGDGGGSTRDYQAVMGENPVTAGSPNPLDVVIPPERPARMKGRRVPTDPADRSGARF